MAVSTFASPDRNSPSLKAGLKKSTNRSPFWIQSHGLNAITARYYFGFSSNPFFGLDHKIFSSFIASSHESRNGSCLRVGIVLSEVEGPR
jgi:hypothetical protein